LFIEMTPCLALHTREFDMLDRRPSSIIAAVFVSAELISFCFCAHAFAGVGSILTPSMTTVMRDAPLSDLAPSPALAKQTMAALKTVDLPLEVASPPAPFSQTTTPWFGGDIFSNWSRAVTEMHAESDVMARCSENMSACPEAARKLLAIIAIGRAHTGRARVGTINRAVNLAIRPIPMDESKHSDIDVADLWRAPLESLASGRGDCKDYAIIKYVALVAAGIAPQDLKLVVVQDLAVHNGHNGHLVVAARVDGRWLVLDNRWLALAEDEELPRLVPKFLIDHDGVRAYLRSTNRASSAGS
jgi:predicted transglutaminase-like cysteine proteinase